MFLLSNNNITSKYYQTKTLHIDWSEFYKDTSAPTDGSGLFQNQNYTGENKLSPTEANAWISNC